MMKKWSRKFSKSDYKDKRNEMKKKISDEVIIYARNEQSMIFENEKVNVNGISHCSCAKPTKKKKNEKYTTSNDHNFILLPCCIVCGWTENIILFK